jgi:competence protein ComFC
MVGNNHLAYDCYRGFWSILDWLYPPVCAGCGASGQRWCDLCVMNTIVMRSAVCTQCGEPNSSTGKCQLCLHSPPAFTALRSWAEYRGPVRRALHGLKYRQNLALGDSLSIHLIHLYNQLNWSVDMIIPVPLSPKRKRSRGYNQAALLARPLSLATGIPYRGSVLIRLRETVSQVGLSEIDRSQNVRGAFSACSDQIRGKTILVVDDITTTGATIQNCALALIDAGADKVYGLTVARAVLAAHNDTSSINPSVA